MLECPDVIRSSVRSSLFKMRLASRQEVALPEKAKFRTFLRCCVERFVFNDYKQASRLKRGGGAEPLAAEFLNSDEEVTLESTCDPETLFETEWIRSVFERALWSLAEIFEKRGKSESYRMFETYYLAEKDGSSCATLAKKFDLSTIDVTHIRISIAAKFEDDYYLSSLKLAFQQSLAGKAEVQVLHKGNRQERR